jgi:alpha-N-arabinofuranosidase
VEYLTRPKSFTGMLALAAGFALLSSVVEADDTTFRNPILRGAHPDPSICRVGNDYYIVNSTFEYFPGLPIHHSTDLVNWELVGHGLHREGQATGAVNLVDVQSDGGIHAPTLRCRDGRFYIITTNVYKPIEDEQPVEFVNFVITADDANGPWSDPHVIAGAPGIDPDLFFDDDGKVWYVGTHSPANPAFPGEGEIWLQELDPENWSLVGERHFLWRGACGGVWSEGPHLYKRDNRYYLQIAEGGTGPNHAVMIAVSDNVTGPYISNPRNPILTSRHLSYDYWVNSTGHGDLVELPDGRWYMVALGIRGDEQRSSNMGRETHLVPVVWEREPFEWQEIKYEWPVAAPETGRVERYSPLPFDGKAQLEDAGFVDEFEGGVLQRAWTFRRVPSPGTYSLTARQGYLRLYASPEVIRERGQASLIGFRQTESEFDYRASMEFEAADRGAEAGLSLFQKDDNYLNFTVIREGSDVLLRLTLAEPGAEPRTIEEIELPDYEGRITLAVSSRDGEYAYTYSLGRESEPVRFARTGAHHILARGSYTGAFLGVYATTNAGDAGPYADFDWVRYRGVERP